jgi:2-iminobutanoate/2-iminopropanoate deaminase
MKTDRLCFGIVAGLLAVASGCAQIAAAPGLRAVTTEDAPKPAGPYSQGVVAGGFLFVAGQTPRDPKTGKPVTETFDAAVARVLDNLEAILKAEGLDWTDVVKTTVYLTKAEDFGPLNAVYVQRLGAGKPARTTVIVASLPNGALLEMDLIARTRK